MVSYLKPSTESRSKIAAKDGTRGQDMPLGNNKTTGKKKVSPVLKALKTAGLIVVYFFQEVAAAIAQGFRKAKDSSLALKMTVAAVLFCVICTGLVVSLTMMVHGEAEEESISDCVIGAKKHVFTAEQAESYAASIEDSTDGKEERVLPDDLYTVTFDFYSKDDVSCVSGERSVGELLELLGVTLEDTDLLRAESEDMLTGDTVIAVDEISYGTDHVSTDIPYETTYQDVQTIPRGSQKTQRRGVTGKNTEEYAVTYINGVETKRTLVREYTSSYPVSAVVYRGVGGTVNIGGTSYSFSYYIDCDSTFYYAGGITASGLPADENVIAVDPRVIPLGTKVYIPGIGQRIAADTGGAIKGNIVDICLDRSNPLCATYGRRGCRVYILG